MTVFPVKKNRGKINIHKPQFITKIFYDYHEPIEKGKSGSMIRFQILNQISKFTSIQKCSEKQGEIEIYGVIDTKL